MTLTHNKLTNQYAWVDDDTDQTLSPPFDSEEAAIKWYGTISRHIFGEYGVTANRPATGTKGYLIRSLGDFVFRVYDQNKNFTDYDIAHSDMMIEIIDSDAWFYDEKLIDHSPDTLGVDNENS